MDVKVLPVLNDNYIFIINIKDKAIVIDPAISAPVVQYLEDHNLSLHAILNTHHHHDHVGGNKELVDKYACEVWAYKHDKRRIPCATHLVDDGDELQILGKSLKVLAVPGHTVGHVAYWFYEDHALFCGDTLFSLGCGRLFEGSPEQMWDSLQKLRALPDQTLVYCAHEYTLSNGKFAAHAEKNNEALDRYIAECKRKRQQDIPTIPSRIDIEKACNPFLRADVQSMQEQYSSVDHPVALFAHLRMEKDNF